ncbi:hypothetical protein Tco_1212083 [Tanacetum coccineum]
MEAAVEQCSVDKKCVEIQMKELHLENECQLEHIICQDVMNIVMHADVLSLNNNCLDNDNCAIEYLKMDNNRLMELLISQDLVHTSVNSLAAINDYKSMQQSYVDAYSTNLKLKAELAKKNNMDKKSLQQSKEVFQNNKPSQNQTAPEFREFFEINDLQARLQAKDVSIEKLKKRITNLKGKNVVESVEIVKLTNVIPLKVYKLDLPPLSPRLKNNREAHVDYLKVTQEHTHTLSDIVDHARTIHPLDNELNYACQVSSSTKACGSKPMSNTRNNRISQTSRSNQNKNKVEDHHRISKSSLNKKNHVSTSVCNEFVKQFVLNTNSKLVCVTCKKCMFDDVHDSCVVEFLNNVNTNGKSKSVKAKSVPPKKNVPPKPYTNVPNPEVKVFHRSTKVAKAVRFKDTPIILGPKISNIKAPNQTWGSKSAISPSSSHVRFRSSKLSSGTWIRAAPST